MLREKQIIVWAGKIEFLKTIKALPIGYSSSWASYGKYIEDDGKVVFAVSTEKDGNAYLRYDPKSNEAKKIAKAEQIPMWLVPLK